MTEMCTAAANYIINSVNKSNRGKPLRDQVIMSSKRLQKLLFFSDVLFMVEHDGKSMYNDEYYAWPSGPVIPSVYRKFMQYQDGEMRPYDGQIHDTIDDKMKHAIDRVLDDTKSLDTSVLVSVSHAAGAPWESCFDENDTEYNNVIPKAQIYRHYLRNGVPYGKTTS